MQTGISREFNCKLLIAIDENGKIKNWKPEFGEFEIDED